MRDPERIDRILATLGELWHKDPDLRLTQLIVNVANVGVPVPDLYHLEDDELERRLANAKGRRQGEEGA